MDKLEQKLLAKLIELDNRDDSLEDNAKGIYALIRQHIPEDKVKCHVQCSRCGNKVSNTVFSSLPEGLVVRAFVECAECIEKTPKLPEDDENIEEVTYPGGTILYKLKGINNQ